jgi:hypothetical protein
VLLLLLLFGRGECDSKCGEATRKRSRKIVLPNIGTGTYANCLFVCLFVFCFRKMKMCISCEALEDVEECMVLPACNCEVTEWSDWSECSVVCCCGCCCYCC